MGVRSSFIVGLGVVVLFSLACARTYYTGPYRSRRPYLQAASHDGLTVTHDGEHSFVISFDAQGMPRVKEGGKILRTPEYDQCDTIAWLEGSFAGVGLAAVSFSRNGLDWERPMVVDKLVGDGSAMGICFDGKNYLVPTEEYEVLESADAKKWHRVEKLPVRYGQYCGIYCDAGEVLLFDRKDIYARKPDGSWEEFDGPFHNRRIDGGDQPLTLKTLTKCGDWYFALTDLNRRRECAVSRDLRHWSCILENAGGEDYFAPSDVSFDGRTYVAVGGFKVGNVHHYIMTSTDAITWRPARLEIPREDLPYPGLNAVTWDGSQFVALGDYRYIVTSRDGAEWRVVGREGANYHYQRNVEVKGSLFPW